MGRDVPAEVPEHEVPVLMGWTYPGIDLAQWHAGALGKTWLQSSPSWESPDTK